MLKGLFVTGIIVLFSAAVEYLLCDGTDDDTQEALLRSLPYGIAVLIFFFIYLSGSWEYWMLLIPGAAVSFFAVPLFIVLGALIGQGVYRIKRRKR